MLQILIANPEEELKVSLQPWQLLPLVLAGWVNRWQQDVIENLLVASGAASISRSAQGQRVLSSETLSCG
jgi:hypothetical protein